MVLTILISAIGIWLLFAGTAIMRHPKGERRSQLPIALLASVPLLLFESALYLTQEWGRAWWQLMLYTAVLLMVVLVVENAVAAWRSRLRLQGKLSPPPGRNFVPKGKILVRMRETQEPESGSHCWLFSIVHQGNLYSPRDGYFTHTEVLDSTGELRVTGRAVGSATSKIREYVVRNMNGKGQILFA